MSSQPPPRGFTREEFVARTEAAQAHMAESGLSALLVCTEPEVRYFTGFHTLFWLSPTRPWFVVIPRDGTPVAVIPQIGAASMAETWIEDIRTWSSPAPADDGVTLLAATIRDLVGGAGLVGVPMGPETHVRMPAADFDQLRQSLPQYPFVDATNIVASLRMVKSAAEIAKVAYICSVVSDAFDGLGELISIGDSEREAFAKFRIDILQRGADDVPYLVGSTGPGGFDNIIKTPSDRRLAAGDLLLFDTGSVYDGYFSDFDRNFAFGHADDATRRAYATVWASTEAGLAAAVPGATTTDVWRAMATVLDAAGSLGNSVGRMGHGLGMQVTEWPSNTATDHTLIQEGMVLTLEPGLTWAPGKMMVHEENVVIRADGAHLLSRRAAPELPIIS